ncbi:MAG: YggS family pyridoxal phosphate-dependent enzyme [Actinomycetes bacterium]
MPADARTERLGRNLAAVESRLEAACRAAGRERSDLVLIAVTKTFPADDVRRLAALGVHDFGENRDQEAAPKAAALRDVALGWHFVGQLQTNKCRSVASYADAVHSVDRLRLVEVLGRAAEQAGRTVDVFVQVSLDDDQARGGATSEELPALADAVAGASGIRLVGVMAVAPVAADAERAFERLATIAARLRVDHPDAVSISAGMSGDLEAAIAAGATHVRIGTALLGDRAPVVR